MGLFSKLTKRFKPSSKRSSSKQTHSTPRRLNKPKFVMGSFADFFSGFSGANQTKTTFKPVTQTEFEPNQSAKRTRVRYRPQVRNPRRMRATR